VGRKSNGEVGTFISFEKSMEYSGCLASMLHFLFIFYMDSKAITSFPSFAPVRLEV